MPDIITPIRSIIDSSEAVFKEKGSVFRSFIYPAKSQEQAEEYLKAVKKKYFDATHHCYAWRLRNNFHYSDAGEPSGTAGIRILNAIDHFGVTEIICIVVRWFGGTKLGVGPLGKAYYLASEAVLKSSKIVQKLPFYLYKVRAPFDLSSTVYHIFDKYEVKIISTEYLDSPEYMCYIPADKKEKIAADLIQISNNRIFLTELELNFIVIP